jgi:hypothetical protein
MQGLNWNGIESLRDVFKRIAGTLSKGRDFSGILSCRVLDVNSIDSAVASRKHATLALRAKFQSRPAHTDSALFDASTAATAKMCSFRMPIVNNQANLWIIVLVVPATDEHNQSNDASQYVETCRAQSLWSTHSTYTNQFAAIVGRLISA